MKAANDALRFLLELSALGAVAYWGWQAAEGAVRWLPAIGAPLTIAVAWGVWIAPKSNSRVDDPVRLLLEALIFGTAAVALLGTGQNRLGLGLVAMVALHLTATFLLGQR